MPRGLVVLLGTAAAVVVVAGIRTAAWLVAPAFLALVIVIAVSPVHRWLRRHRFPAWLATSTLVLLVYGVFLAFLAVLVVSLARLAALLPHYTDRARVLATRAADTLTSWGVEPEKLGELARSIDPGRVLSSVGALLGDLTAVTSNLVFLLALLLFFSTEATGIDTRLDTVARDRPGIRAALGDFTGRTRRFLVVTTVFGLAVAAMDTIALLWLGIPLAVLWGLLSFVTNYIPNIGFVLGVVPPALLALLTGGWQGTLAVLVVYGAINFVLQSLVQPRFVGDAVGLSTVMTFLSLVFWAWVLGPLGALLAVPATLLVMAVLVDVDPRAGWVAALLGANKVPSETGDAHPGRRRLRWRTRHPKRKGRPMATLTIWRFDSSDGARHAAARVEALARSELLTLHDAAIVWWPAEARKPKLRQLRGLAGRGALSGAFWGMLFGLIFLVPLFGLAVGAAAGATSGALADVGVDDDLIRRIRDELTPGTSALFLLTTDAVLDKVRDAFAEPEQPHLMFTNLTAAQEESLRQIFADEPGEDEQTPSSSGHGEVRA
jgi:AI-2 transport protein TqsA